MAQDKFLVYVAEVTAYEEESHWFYSTGPKKFLGHFKSEIVAQDFAFGWGRQHACFPEMEVRRWDANRPRETSQLVSVFDTRSELWMFVD